MIEKPHDCDNCPAREWGPFWVPDRVNNGSEVFILLQNPGEYEEGGHAVISRVDRSTYTTESTTPQPLIGPTGYDAETRWFPIAGLNRETLSLGNTIRCRQHGSNELPTLGTKGHREVSVYCQQRHLRIPETTKLIVACGAYAAHAMGCPGTISDWRGYLIPEGYTDLRTGHVFPVLCTLHPADLHHHPRMTIPCIKDWEKIPRILNGEWPSPLPPIQYYRDSEEDRAWFTEALKAPFVSVDTEYSVESPSKPGALKLIGLYTGATRSSLAVWWPSDHKDTFIVEFRKLVKSVPVVMWNAVADIPVIEAALGVGYQDYTRIDDPMLKHALLWSELPHTLEFCASCDGKYPKLKHLMDKDLALYNQGDVLETSHLNQVYDKELDDDPQTRHVYETQALPLIPVILRSQKSGVRVNREAVVGAIQQHRGILTQALSMAQVSSGLDINLGSSKQVQAYLYTQKGYQIQKHYKTKRPTVNQDAINLLRSTFLPIDAEYEEKEGIDDAYIQGRIRQGADPFLEAHALFSSVRAVLSTYLYGLLSDVYQEMDENKRKRLRAALHDRPISPTDVVSRVYPQYKQHTQANGRWSITDPPLAGCPKLLHHLFIPDHGTVWIKYDFKQIEPRIRACLSHDTPRLQAFTAGKDIYEATSFEMFGKYSPTLRKLAKTVELALSYGKKPMNMHHVPGIMGYGFSKKELTYAADNYLRAHPEQTVWMAKHIESLHQCGYSREPVGGRRRNLLGHWGDIEREGLNHPMQAGATSLTNLTILRICEKVPYATLVNNRFDEHWWSVPLSLLEEARATMATILNQRWTICGTQMAFPVDPPNLTVIYPPEGVR